MFGLDVFYNMFSGSSVSIDVNVYNINDILNTTIPIDMASDYVVEFSCYSRYVLTVQS